MTIYRHRPAPVDKESACALPSLGPRGGSTPQSAQWLLPSHETRRKRDSGGSPYSRKYVIDAGLSPCRSLQARLSLPACARQRWHTPWGHGDKAPSTPQGSCPLAERGQIGLERDQRCSWNSPVAHPPAQPPSQYPRRCAIRGVALSA